MQKRIAFGVLLSERGVLLYTVSCTQEMRGNPIILVAAR
jgi:hypothetical protein